MIIFEVFRWIVSTSQTVCCSSFSWPPTDSSQLNLFLSLFPLQTFFRSRLICALADSQLACLLSSALCLPSCLALHFLRATFKLFSTLGLTTSNCFFLASSFSLSVPTRTTCGGQETEDTLWAACRISSIVLGRATWERQVAEEPSFQKFHLTVSTLT